MNDRHDGIFCNLNTIGNGEQKSFTVAVRPLANSTHGSTFTTTQRVYAVDDDGSDRMTDTVEAGGLDQNGDGIVDDRDADADADADGDGYLDALDDGVLNGVGLPDADNNGVMDVDEPALGAATVSDVDESALGAASGEQDVILTGLSGGGCSVTGAFAVGSNARSSLDPVMLILCVGAAAALIRRHRFSQARYPGTLMIVVSGSLFYVTLLGLPDQVSASDLTLSEITDEDTTQRRGFYFGAGLGQSWLEPDTSGADGVDPNDRVGPAGQFLLGWDWSDRWSVEAQLSELGDAGLSPSGQINYREYGASALLYLNRDSHRDLREGLAAYGRLGFGMLQNSADEEVPARFEQNKAAHYLFGIGAEYGFASGFGIRAGGRQREPRRKKGESQSRAARIALQASVRSCSVATAACVQRSHLNETRNQLPRRVSPFAVSAH